MEVHILTIFPEMFTAPLQASILQRAQERGLLQVQVHNLRDFTTDRHHVTDDAPYGGGAGMLMKPEPIVTGVHAIQARFGPAYVVLLSPQGVVLTQDLAKHWPSASVYSSSVGATAVWMRACRPIRTPRYPLAIMSSRGGNSQLWCSSMLSGGCSQASSVIATPLRRTRSSTVSSRGHSTHVRSSLTAYAYRICSYRGTMRPSGSGGAGRPCGQRCNVVRTCSGERY